MTAMVAPQPQNAIYNVSKNSNNERLYTPDEPLLMNHMHSLTFASYAKVNLGLNVIAKRADGFHEIDSVLARIALYDTITLHPHTGINLQVIDADLPTDSRNLAYDAAVRFLAPTPQLGVHLTLHKRIPIAAGLGGGSSNAAAVLRGLQQLYPERYTSAQLMALAAEIGSDVPFFMLDAPSARTQGRGEQLTPLPLPRTVHMVLINPGVAISAGAAYAKVRAFESKLSTSTFLHNLQADQPFTLTNSLTAGVLAAYPEVEGVLTALQEVTVPGFAHEGRFLSVQMSGSGSSCLGIALNSAHARAAAAQLQTQHPTWWVQTTHTF